MKSRIPSRILDTSSFLGALFAVVGFGASCFGLLIDLFNGDRNPYQGLLTFLLFPGLMVLGFLMMLPRFVVRHLPRRQTGTESETTIGLQDRKHLWILIGPMGFVALFLIVSIVGAFRAYEFTESKEFCGELCHESMQPQLTAFEHSPHASLSCTACHVGPGVDRYLEAKVSGLRQVYQVLGNSYARPIRAPRDGILPVGSKY